MRVWVSGHVCVRACGWKAMPATGVFSLDETATPPACAKSIESRKGFACAREPLSGRVHVRARARVVVFVCVIVQVCADH